MSVETTPHTRVSVGSQRRGVVRFSTMLDGIYEVAHVHEPLKRLYRGRFRFAYLEQDVGNEVQSEARQILVAGFEMSESVPHKRPKGVHNTH